MVADTDHPNANVSDGKDGNISPTEADIAEQATNAIFDVVKTG